MFEYIGRNAYIFLRDKGPVIRGQARIFSRIFSKPIPIFANDAEEHAFWEKHDSTDYLDWTKVQRVVLPNLKPTKKTISLRLPQHLLDSIKVVANSRDVPYQSLIKVWLQEKL